MPVRLTSAIAPARKIAVIRQQHPSSRQNPDGQSRPGKPAERDHGERRLRSKRQGRFGQQQRSHHTGDAQ
jgi:hypothetical protein